MTSTDDPLGVFTASEAAITAAATELLRRTGIYGPTMEQLEDARESAKLEYEASARHALETGRVI